MRFARPLARSPARPLKLKDYFLCVLSAVLLIISFPNFNFWLFAWFGFVPLFFALQNKSKIQAFLLAYLSGVVFWLGTVYWLVHVTPPGMLLVVFYLALYFGFFGLIISRPHLVLSPYYLVLVPSFWVSLEYLRGYLLTGFPWALLGYSQYKNLAAIQIADITGAWGVSFLVMMVNVLVYKIVGHQVTLPVRQAGKSPGHKLQFNYLIPVILLVFSFGYGFYKLQPRTPNPACLPVRQEPRTIKISLIQANIPQELKWDPRAKESIMRKYLALTKSAAADIPDLIIWPEAASPCFLGKEEGCFKDISGLIQQIHIPLLFGTVATRGDIFYNSALLVGRDGKYLAQYDKIHLVPFGEYIPLRKIFPFLDTIVPIGDFSAGKKYTVFEAPNPEHRLPAGQAGTPNKFSVLICFEDAFPELSRAFVRRGADFLVNITNDAWFGRTSNPYQHLSASVLRAVENNVYVVRAANTGVSAFISPRGEIVSVVGDEGGRQIFIEGYRTQNINLKEPRLTFYGRWGDVFIFLSSIFIICSIFFKL